MLLPLLAVVALSSTVRGAAPEKANQPKEQKEAPAVVGQFITLEGAIDDRAIGKVQRIGLALQNRAEQGGKKGVLVLQIMPGTSRFHNVQGLANFLSKDLGGLKKVAWIPEDLTGNNVVVALACNDIVLHPDKVLGDIGLGKSLDQDERTFVVNLVHRRHNNKLSEALVLGMMDPESEVIQVQIQTGEPPNETTETRLVLPNEFDRLQQEERAVMPRHHTVKHPGRAGTFTGSQASNDGFLVSATAESRQDVADLYQLPRESMREDPAGGSAPEVRLIKFEGFIDSMLEGFVSRQIQRSVGEGANLLVFHIDSYGGEVFPSIEIANTIADLSSKKVRTVAYIPEKAISGAALVALGCDEIYMHPDAQFGDIGAIRELQQGGQFEWVPQKLLGPLKETLDDLARKKNRPSALTVAMTIKELEVFQVEHSETGRIWYMTDDEIHANGDEWIKGLPVPETRNDQLLTVKGKRAQELLLAEAPVSSFDELRERLAIPADVKLDAVGRTWVDSLVFELNRPGMKALLIILGIIGIYIELHITSGLFGIGAGVCFALYFWAAFLGGTADWLEVVLFVCGLVCLAIEIFVIPGLTVFGISGGLLIIASLLLASQTFVIPHSSAEMDIFARSIGSLSGAIVGVILLAVAINRFLPKMPMMGQMILTPPGADMSDRPQLAPELTGGTLASLVGELGTATTVLRPAGKARIGDRLMDVVSDGPYIDAGSSLEVIASEGNHVIVRKI